MQIIEVLCAVYCQNFKLYFLMVSKKVLILQPAFESMPW